MDDQYLLPIEAYTCGRKKWWRFGKGKAERKQFARWGDDTFWHHLEGSPDMLKEVARYFTWVGERWKINDTKRVKSFSSPKTVRVKASISKSGTRLSLKVSGSASWLATKVRALTKMLGRDAHRIVQVMDHPHHQQDSALCLSDGDLVVFTPKRGQLLTTWEVGDLTANRFAGLSDMFAPTPLPFASPDVGRKSGKGKKKRSRGGCYTEVGGNA